MELQEAGEAVKSWSDTEGIHWELELQLLPDPA